MKPPPRIDARSPSLLPWISSVEAHTMPTKPVKMFSTVTSRFSSSVGCAVAAGLSPAGASAAARAWPTSQIPFTTRTAPTYSSITLSSIGSPPSVAQHPWGRRVVPVRQRPARLGADDIRLVGASPRDPARSGWASRRRPGGVNNRRAAPPQAGQAAGAPASAACRVSSNSPHSAQVNA
jgi:hypothetical protein